MLCDSHSLKPSSSIVGTRPVGFIFRYSGVLLTPKCKPASMRSYLRPSSSAAHSAFLTLTELTRPQIFNIKKFLKAGRLTIPARVARCEIAAVELPEELRGAELVVVVHGDDPVPAALQLGERLRGEIALLDA